MLATLLLIQVIPVEQWHTVKPKDGGTLRTVLITPTLKDYAKKAQKADAEGNSVIELTIGLNGRLVGCRTVQTAGHGALDKRACALYRRRGRFQVSGRTTPVVINAVVRWILRYDEP